MTWAVGDKAYRPDGTAVVITNVDGETWVTTKDGMARRADLRREPPAPGRVSTSVDTTPVSAKAPSTRRITLTPASTIGKLATHWIWDNWLPVGALSLLAGREGIGKSTIGYERAARLTRGELPGRFLGQPRGVIICATEDSWRRTIVPRLEAHGADLDRIYRADVETVHGYGGALILPTDLGALENAILENDVAMVLLDPLLSRLDEKLNTHVDAEVRQALEPLAALADRTGVNVLGIIHVNKSTGRDAGDRIMGSRAFVAVARSVLFVVQSPDDEAVKVLGMTKNSLGQLDGSGYTNRIEGVSLGLDAHGDEVTTGHIVWEGASQSTIAEMLRASDEDPDKRSAVKDAAAWMAPYIVAVGGRQTSAIVKIDGLKAGHLEHNLKRAMSKAGVTSERSGFPSVTWWVVDVPTEGSQSEQSLDLVA